MPFQFHRTGFGESVVERRQLNPWNDRLGLYLWGTIGWHALIVVGTLLLV